MAGCICSRSWAEGHRPEISVATADGAVVLPKKRCRAHAGQGDIGDGSPGRRLFGCGAALRRRTSAEACGQRPISTMRPGQTDMEDRVSR
jgi:hypothetical protein